jgi:hypothetical protein
MRPATDLCYAPRDAEFTGATAMSKAQDQKKEVKKKATKTLAEKRAAKKEKKAAKAFMQMP